jgi:hypothetical protein
MIDQATGEVLNPVDLEQRIQQLANDIPKGVRVVSDAYDLKLTKDREYDHAFAAAFLAWDGPQTEKRYAAERATLKEREARDQADVAFRYAERRMRALEGTLSALQTISKTVLAMYGAAGKGGY